MGAHATDHDDSETDGPKVLSVSPRNPRVRTIQIHRPAPQDASFLAATAKGLGVTLRHFFKNVLRGKDHNYIETVEYPEKKVDYPERFRGLHRLMHRDERRGPLRRLHVLPDGVPGALHHDRPGPD